MGKADIGIGPFYEIPKLMSAELSIAPNNVLRIKKNNVKCFELTVRDICPTYNVSVRLATWPTCTNWKLKSILLDFPVEGVTVDDVSCKFNKTHATLNKSADSDSQFYYNISFINETFTKNVTKKITLPTKWVNNEPRKNLTLFVKLCADGCRNCGSEKSFLCYSEIPTINRREEVFKNMLPYIWVLLGIFFVVILIALLWVNYARRATRYSKTKFKDISHFPKENVFNAEVRESLSS